MVENETAIWITAKLQYEKGHSEEINTCSKSAIETLEEGGKYVQSQQ